MYILTQSKPLENCGNKILRIQAVDLEEYYDAAGYQRRERIYTIKQQNKEYRIICPEFRKGNKGEEVIVIIPELLIPRRPYPVYIYLYAIDVYSSNPCIGQREAAKATQKQFGLIHFAHTTLGRALKAFVHNINEIENASDNSSDGTMSGRGKEDETQKISAVESGVQEKDGGNQPCFPSRRSTEPLRNKASKLLRGNILRSCGQQAIEGCYDLVRRWFKEYQRFLL